MLAIACVMEGQSREEAAEACGMDRQTLRGWVHRFNHMAEGAHAALALDQAGWRTSPKLQVPENVSLPPRAPDLNPVEQAWACLRASVLSHRVWNRCDAIVGACCDAWNTLMSTPERPASIARRTWAKAASR